MNHHQHGGLTSRTLTLCVYRPLSVCLLLLSPLALAQKVILNPTTLAFNTQPVGTTSASKTVTLTNISPTKTLTITSIVASGEFADTTTCTGTLAPSASCTLSVTFTPTTVGTIDGAITFSDNSAPGTQIVSMTGKGLAPATLAPASLTFASTAVGKTSVAKTVRLTNSTVALTMGAVTASGDFNISTNTCTGIIAASTSCTISVTFAPTFTGSITGALTVADSASGSPQVVPLSGTASGTVTNPVSFSPTSLTFSSQPTGTTSSSQSVTLTNNGVSALTITTVSASGNYSETDTCAGQSIPASGGTCTIAVTFTPTAAGTIQGAITVVDGDPTSPQVFALTGTGVSALSFSPGSLAFTGSVGIVGTPQTATLTNNSNNTITLSNVAVSGDYTETNTCGGSVAASSSCTFSVSFAPLITGTIDGAVTVTASGMAAPVVLGLTGTSTATTAIARYGYAVEYSALTSGLIVGYSMNPGTGQLRALEAVQLPSTNYGIVADPSSKFLYIPDGSQILAYSIGSNGLLQVLSGSPYTLPGGSVLKFTPNGKFAYTNTGAEYSLNSTTGALTQLGTATTGSKPFDVAMTPTGTFVYIPNFADATISAFSINQTTGALAAITGSPFAAGDIGPAAAVVSPNGKFLFVANSSTANTGSISVFSINSTTGALTPVTGSPFTGSGPGNGITVDPSSQFLYVASTGLDAYLINQTTGGLTAITGSPYTIPAAAFGVTIDPTGKFLYASIFGNLTAPQTAADVITYSINTTTGVLTQIGTQGVDGNQGEMFAITTGSKAVAYTPKFAYATNQGSQNISEYAINGTTGALTAVSASPLSDVNGPQLIAATPSGAFVYTANSNNSISEYRVNATTGALTLVTGSPITGFGSVNALVVDPTSSFLLVLDSTNRVLDSYAINVTTGALSFLASSPTRTATSQTVVLDPTGTIAIVTSLISVDYYKVNNGALSPLKSNSGTNSPLSAAIDQSSQFVFVAELNGNAVVTYALPSGTLLSSAVTGNNPRAVLAEPSGKYVYVANAGDGTISAYGLNSSTGALTQIGSAFTAAAGTDALTTSNDGKFLCATNNTAGTISIFTINADGTLTPAGTATTGTFPTSIATTGMRQ